MSSLRKYELTVGIFSDTPQESSKTADAYFISELDMSCSIQADNAKSHTSSDNTTLTLTNLPKEARDELKKQGCMVMLKAGYSDRDLPVLYVGTVIHSRTAQSGNDKITTVIASGDMMERSGNTISHSFAPNTSAKVIIETLIKQMGLPRGNVDLSTLNGKVYGSGISVYGRTANELTRLCGENNLRWFTTNKRINVQPYRPNQTMNVEVWDVYPEQMLGSITETYSQTQTIDKPKKQKKGDTAIIKPISMNTVTKNSVSVSVHLDGRINVGSYVRLNDVGDFIGVYRAEGVNHRLGYRSGSWETSLDLLPV